MNAVQPSRLWSFASLAAVALTLFACCALWAGALYELGYRRSRSSYLKNYRSPTSAEMRISMAMQYAEESAERNDVLLLGDATCESISMAAVERATGLRAWSLCVVGLVESDGMAALLRRYLEHHPAPRLVIVVRHPFGLLWSQVQRSPGLARNRWDFLRRYEPARREPLFSRSDERVMYVREGWRNLLGMIFGALRHPLDATVSDCERDPGAGARFGVTFPADVVLPDSSQRCPGVGVEEVRREYLRSHGAAGGALYASDPSVPGRHNDAHNGILPHANADDEMDSIVRLALHRHIPTLVRFSPVMRGPRAPASMIETFLQHLAARNPGIAVARPPLPQYDPGLFEDMLHLNEEGAEQLTVQTIEDVRGILGR